MGVVEWGGGGEELGGKRRERRECMSLVMEKDVEGVLKGIFLFTPTQAFVCTQTVFRLLASIFRYLIPV